MTGRNFHVPADSLHRSSLRQAHSYVVAPASNRGFYDKKLKNPAVVRELLLSCPDQLALLRQNNPELAAALNSENMDRFARVLKDKLTKREAFEKERKKIMNMHPYDIEGQKAIENLIIKRNIEANLEAALEYGPETFGSVTMLYINCKVNGYPVKAFVDSGAQTTIMSSECAQRCNIMRLVDKRWQGIAKGVGMQRIIGRIHMVQIAIEKDFLITTMSILNNQPMDVLLGLDMLKRHQCSIDLKRNVLKIGTTGTISKFLPERYMPEYYRATSGSDEEDETYKCSLFRSP
ncbi:hypothetical protein WDU94_000628 [Cyamophila willieti]